MTKTDLQTNITQGSDETGAWLDLTVEGVTQKFRWIPMGRYMMGSPEDEPGRWDDERLHEEIIKNGFWMADTPCTQAFWEVVMGNNPSNFKNPQNPVETVSYFDVKEFIRKLNEISGMNFDLPNEIQWEYACRAGTTTAFHWGDHPEPRKANYYSAKRSKNGPCPVGSYEPNAWGLYDMHGNVAEWCRPAPHGWDMGWL